ELAIRVPDDGVGHLGNAPDGGAAGRLVEAKAVMKSRRLIDRHQAMIVDDSSRGKLRSGLGLSPRVVSPEAPQMALGIATGIKTTAVVLIFDFHDDLGTGRFGARIMRVGVLDDDIGALGPDAAGFPRRFDPLAEFVLARRAQHDHAIAESELRMRDCSVLAGNDEVLFEPEGLAQPFDRGIRIAISHRRNDGRYRVLGVARHSASSGGIRALGRLNIDVGSTPARRKTPRTTGPFRPYPASAVRRHPSLRK